MKDPVPPKVAAAVLERAGEHCEACGWPAAILVLHHRKGGRGGRKHTVANLMAVHPDCHTGTRWCIHLNVAASEALGHLLKANEDPEKVPFITEPRLRVLRR